MGRSDNSHKIFPRFFLRIELLAINKGVCSPTWDSYLHRWGVLPLVVSGMSYDPSIFVDQVNDDYAGKLVVSIRSRYAP